MRYIPSNAFRYTLALVIIAATFLFVVLFWAIGRSDCGKPLVVTVTLSSAGVQPSDLDVDLGCRHEISVRWDNSTSSDVALTLHSPESAFTVPSNSQQVTLLKDAHTITYTFGNFGGSILVNHGDSR